MHINTQDMDIIKDTVDNFRVIKHKVTDEKISFIVSNWTQKTLWPQELNEQVLLAKKEIIFIPYLEINGDVSTHYHVDVGTYYKAYNDCTKCNRTGKVEKVSSVAVYAGREIGKCSTCHGKGRMLTGSNSFGPTYGICIVCHGSGTYDAGPKYRKEKKVDIITCSKCKGRGEVEVTLTSWKNITNQGNVSIRNFDVGILTNEKIHCGDRILNKSDYDLATKIDGLKIYKIHDFSKDKSYFLNKTHNVIQKQVQSEADTLGDKVKNVHISDEVISTLKYNLYLYPIITSSFEYQNEQHILEIDGITGKLYVEVPKTIKTARLKRTAKLVVISTALLIAVTLIINLIH